MPSCSPRALLCLSVTLAAAAADVVAQSWLPTSPFPSWATAPAGSVTALAYDPSLTAQQNGLRLETAAENLLAGESLSVGPGTWSVPNRFDLSLQGTASQPIRIFATDPNARPVITRPDAAQNCLNLGGQGPCRYLVLQDLELTGGSDLVRLYDAAFVWIDGCWLHDGHGVGVAAQTHGCTHLHLTRNEIARPGPGTTGEGMYLGANFGAIAITDSVIAGNHVHDLRGAVSGQGDGIELKQGSTRNWIFANLVHGSRNPCILVYGTGGIDENVVDANVCYDADDAALQVQGEAIVRNNLVVNGSGGGFHSHDHQGVSSHLQLLHNTIVSSGRAADLGRWGNRTGMVLANNVVCSTAADSVWFGSGDAGVTATGNVISGPSNRTGAGYTVGRGLADFEAVDVVTFALDARPVIGGAIDNRGDPSFALAVDLAGRPRTLPPDPGAFANDGGLDADTATLPTTGGVQNLALDLGPAHGGATYLLAASLQPAPSGFVAAGFHVPIAPDWLFAASITGSLPTTFRHGIGSLDAAGRAAVQVAVPNVGPAFAGLRMTMTTFAVAGGLVTHVSNPVALTLR